jgi:large subunit ribosomal protein L6
VSVTIDGSELTVKGPKGTVRYRLHGGIEATLADGLLRLQPEAGREAELSPLHGLDRALLNNVVIGVTKGFVRRLEIHGTGYVAKVAGQNLELQIGLSHPVQIAIPPDLKVEVPQPDRVMISGTDKQRVGEFAATVRRVRKPEPYKGKGIRYENEVVRRKAGKTMASGA